MNSSDKPENDGQDPDDFLKSLGDDVFGEGDKPASEGDELTLPTGPAQERSEEPWEDIVSKEPPKDTGVPDFSGLGGGGSDTPKAETPPADGAGGAPEGGQPDLLGGTGEPQGSPDEGDLGVATGQAKERLPGGLDDTVAKQSGGGASSTGQTTTTTPTQPPKSKPAASGGPSLIALGAGGLVLALLSGLAGGYFGQMFGGGNDPSDQLKQVNTTLSQLSQKADELKNDTAALKTETQALKTESAKVPAEIKKTETAVRSELTQKLSTVDDTIKTSASELKKNLTDDLNKGLGEAKKQTADVEKSVKELEKKLASGGGAPGARAPTIDATKLLPATPTNESLTELLKTVQDKPLSDADLARTAAWCRAKWSAPDTTPEQKKQLLEILSHCDFDFSVVVPVPVPSSTPGSNESSQIERGMAPMFVAWWQGEGVQLPEQLNKAADQLDEEEKVDRALWDLKKTTWENMTAAPVARVNAGFHLARLAYRYSQKLDPKEKLDVQYMDKQIAEAVKLMDAADLVAIKSLGDPAAPGFSSMLRTRAKLSLLRREIRMALTAVQLSRVLSSQISDLSKKVDGLKAGGGPGGAAAPTSLDDKRVADFLKQLEQRLADKPDSEAIKKARAEIDDLKKAKRKDLSGSDAANLLLRLQRVAFDVAELTLGGTKKKPMNGGPKVVPQYAQAKAFREFLAKLNLAQLRPPAGASKARQELWGQLSAALDAVNAKLRGAGNLTLDDASRRHLELDELLHLAARLDALNQIAAHRTNDPHGGDTPGPKGKPHRGGLASLPPGLATQRDLNNAMAQLNRDLADIQRSADDAAAKQTAALEARVAALEKNLRAEIAAVKSAPRPLPSQQLGQVVQQVLNKMAEYGYTPPASRPSSGSGGTMRKPVDSARRPRVTVERRPRNPDLARAAFSMGRQALFSRDAAQLADAVDFFSSAVAHDTAEPTYRYYLALALRRQGREREAVAQVRVARNRETRFQRAQIAVALQSLQGPERLWLEQERVRF